MAKRTRVRAVVKPVKAWAHVGKDRWGHGYNVIDPNYISATPGYWRWGKDILVLISPLPPKARKRSGRKAK